MSNIQCLRRVCVPYSYSLLVFDEWGCALYNTVRLVGVSLQ